jgi:hypothetical protein
MAMFKYDSYIYSYIAETSNFTPGSAPQNT